jgi:hypothetical protein
MAYCPYRSRPSHCHHHHHRGRRLLLLLSQNENEDNKKVETIFNHTKQLMEVTQKDSVLSRSMVAPSRSTTPT